MTDLVMNYKKGMYLRAFIVDYLIYHLKSLKIHSFWLKQYNLINEYIAQK